MEVSVIIPNYNYAKYIEECINSVLESDFDPKEFEIVVVDDASKDNSVEVVNKIKLTTSVHINQIVHETNSGLVRSRNTGIKSARGKYLFFLDSDNYITNECLKKHYEFITHNETYSACYAPIQKFDNETKRSLGVMSNDAYYYARLVLDNYLDATSMIRKDDLIEIGLFDTEIPYNGLEDYELWLRMGSHKKKVHFIEGEPLTYYRVHKNSMIHTIPSANKAKINTYIKTKFNLKEPSTSIIPIYRTNIKMFWAAKDGITSEERAVFEHALLNWKENKIIFRIPPSQRDVEYLRFDFGEQPGLINVHSIVIKDTDNKVIWNWQPYEVLSKDNIIWITDKKYRNDRTLQVSTNTDPQFVVQTKLLTNDLIVNGHSIEISLSAVNNDQLEVINAALNKPLQPDIEIDDINKVRIQLNELTSRLCIFSCLQVESAVSDSVYYYLNYLHENNFDVVFVTNLKLSASDGEKLKKVCKKLVENGNIESDFYAYKLGLLTENYGSIYGSVLLTNACMHGPLFTLQGIMNKMAIYDFWGLSDSYEIAYHLPGYFLFFNSTVTSTKIWKVFWDGLNNEKGRRNNIPAYDVDLSRLLIESSLFNYSSYVKYHDLVKYMRELNGYYFANGRPKQRKYDATLFYWDILIDKFSFPFFKKDVLNEKAKELGIISKDWKEVITQKSDYPISLIKEL